MKTVTKLLPGCALALVIAAIAKLLESLEASAGLHLIGASVIALFIGMLVNHFYRPNDRHPLHIQKDSEICDHSARRKSEHHDRSDRRQVLAHGYALYACHLLWARLLHRQGAGAELEDQQPD